MRNRKLQSVVLCSLALLLILGLSAGVVGLAFKGASIVSLSDRSFREIPASLNADFSAYGDRKEELDPAALYDRACRQTVYIYWVQVSEEGKENTISGSGIIVSSDGYIMTNTHCVSEAMAAGADMTVELYDGRSFTAEIIGADSESDIALMKINASGLFAAALSTAKPKGCQKVYAMGHPRKELKFTMTSGIISGMNRTIEVDDGSVMTMLQFDAPVNPGNSGGPLYDAYGAVIGIVTAKYMSINTEGLGFAIPIQDALRIASELKEYGYVTGRPLMGITAIGVEEDNLRPGSPAGVMIFSATEGLPGARAGLTKGDIIVSLDGETITGMNDLTRIKQGYKAGDTVKLRFWRAGEYLEVYLTFDEVTPDHPVGPVTVEPEGNEEDNGDTEASGESEAGEQETGEEEGPGAE